MKEMDIRKEANQEWIDTFYFTDFIAINVRKTNVFFQRHYQVMNFLR